MTLCSFPSATALLPPSPQHYPLPLHRALREQMYKAYISRASEGDMDNTPIIDKVRLCV